jgi:hypothetical protein
VKLTLEYLAADNVIIHVKTSRHFLFVFRELYLILIGSLDPTFILEDGRVRSHDAGQVQF